MRCNKRMTPIALMSLCTLGTWTGLAAASEGPTPFLGPPIASPIANATGRLRVVDINHDGNFEIIVGACDDAGGITVVMTYSVDSSFRAVQAASGRVSCPRDLLVQDFNGDGHLDVLAGAWDGQGPLAPSLLEGRIDGLFAAPRKPISYGYDHNWSGFLSVVDGDDNGLPDVALPYDNSDSGPTSWGITVVSGQDFHEIADISFGPNNPGSPIGAMDVNGDKQRDVIFGDVSVVRSGQTWQIVDNGELGVPRLKAMSRVIDYNGDGVSDLLVVEDTSPTMYVCLTRNSLICGESLPIPTGLLAAPRKIAIKDLNHDGVKDFVTSSGDQLAFAVSRVGGGYDTSSMKTLRGQGVTGIVVADVNCDRKYDLIVSYFSELEIYPGK